MSTLSQAAQRLARYLAVTNRRIVFAESCTAGLASASLASVPGISRWLCGSAVTYREQTKVDWLGVAADDITQWDVVSATVAMAMAKGILHRTAEADFAGAITGHLGPDAPKDLDGIVFIGIAWREPDGTTRAESSRHRLHSDTRRSRQVEAAGLLLDQVGTHRFGET